MATRENTMSLAGQHALEDMVEFEMYLVDQSQQSRGLCSLVAPGNFTEPGKRG
jgi:hypothetical protein